MRNRNTVRGTISTADIIIAYQEAFRIPLWKLVLDTIARLFGVGSIFQLADQYYQELDEELLFNFLEQDKTDLEKYVAEDFDCDDFTFRLYGLLHMDLRLAAMPIFITWVSWTKNGQRYGHAVLSYYKDGEVHIIEPQNDEVYSVPKEWSLILVCG